MKTYVILGKYQEDASVLRAFTSTNYIKEFLCSVEEIEKAHSLFDNWLFVVDGERWELTLCVFEDGVASVTMPLTHDIIPVVTVLLGDDTVSTKRRGRYE